jgi:hypothetical protein
MSRSSFSLTNSSGGSNPSSSGATGNPGFFDGSWGIPIEDRHIHLQVGTSHSNGFIPKASLIDPRIFILTQINENGLVEN